MFERVKQLNSPSEGEDNEKGRAVDLETASLCASPLSKAECKNVFLSSQAHPGMEWAEILWLGTQWNDFAKDNSAPHRGFKENDKVSQENRIDAGETAVICEI